MPNSESQALTPATPINPLPTLLVMKFGGTLMGSTEAIKHSASLVTASVRAGVQVVVVPSAMSGITDQLLKVAASAEAGQVDFAQDEIAMMRERHLSTARGLGQLAERSHESALETAQNHESALETAQNHESALETALYKLNKMFDSLSQTVQGIYLLRELSVRSRDLIVSFGERLSAPLMTLALTGFDLNAQDFTGGEAGLVTNNNFGNARPLPIAFERINERLGEHLNSGLTPVVTGFIGETEKGAITTLGRGGSDYSATILGAALAASEVWTWKDVDGVMTTDPRMVKEAQNIEQLSYLEIMEMAYFGAKVLHPLAVTPLQDRGIPLRVKSAADPNFAGTLVTAVAKPVTNVIKAVTAVRNAAIIDVGGAGMVGVPEVVSKIFDVLTEKNVNVMMISQSSSMANISLVVQQADAQRAFDALKAQFENSEFIKNFEFWEEIAVIAIVGEGMRGAKGVSAKLFTALAEAGVNVEMISQGSSESNISVAIDDVDCLKAVQAVHAAFHLDKLENV
jgi:aspartate kinase